jgi:hypothetical protein
VVASKSSRCTPRSRALEQPEKCARGAKVTPQLYGRAGRLQLLEHQASQCERVGFDHGVGNVASCRA